MSYEMSNIKIGNNNYEVKDAKSRLKIEELTNKTNSLASGSPLVASSTSEMTDTKRVYVNTTDGKWYFYNGSEWVAGGVYQATEFPELTDVRTGFNGVTYDTAGNSIRTQFNIMGNALEGENKKNINIYNKLWEITSKYIYSDGTTIYNDPSTISLNIPINTGLVIGIDMEDFVFNIIGGYIKENAVIEPKQLCYFKGVSNTNPNHLVGFKNPYSNDKYYYFIINPNEDADSFMFNIKIKFYDIRDKIKVIKLENFFIEENLRKLADINSSSVKFDFNEIDKTNTTLITTGYLSSANASLGNMYMDKGVNHRFALSKIEQDKTHYIYTRQIGGDVAKTNGAFLFTYDKDFTVIRQIDNTNVETVILNNQEYILQSFTPTSEEKYLAFTYNLKLDNGSEDYILDYKVTTELVNTLQIKEINNVPIHNPMVNMKWYAIGDSITEKNYRALKNYVDYCTEDLNIETINLGISGTGYKKSSYPFHTRLNSITNYNPKTDIITVMGSINDISLVKDNLGELGDTTTDTLYGSMYQFFNTLFTKFTGARVGLITPICSNTSQNNEDWTNYRKALIETAKQFNVPYLDITDMCNLRPWEEDFRNNFFLSDGIGNSGQVDGVHPNSLGHKLFYGRIKEFLKTL